MTAVQGGQTSATIDDVDRANPNSATNKELILKAAKQGGVSDSVKAVFDAGYKPDYEDIEDFIEVGNWDIVLAALDKMNSDIPLDTFHSLIETTINESNDNYRVVEKLLSKARIMEFNYNVKMKFDN